MRRGASASTERDETQERGADSRPIAERVRRSLHRYTAAEQRVARALLDHYPVAGLETVARFAKRAGTSGPTILRFVNRLGFASYAVFQNALRSEVQSQLQSWRAMPHGRAGAMAAISTSGSGWPSAAISSGRFAGCRARTMPRSHG